MDSILLTTLYFHKTLQIQLYYDKMDVCNPIGSKSSIHKLGKTI